MLKVAICDDNKSICTQIEDTITHYGDSFQKNIEVEVYYSGESLFEAIENGYDFDLIFLDIELGDLNGIDVGKLIRSQPNNQITQIVYISCQATYAMELFDIHPLNFLIKPLDSQKIIESIEFCYSLYNKLDHYFTYKVRTDTKRVPIRDIIYFESHNRKIDMMTIHGVESFYGKLDVIYETLKEFQFLYIHKSYLVNYYFVDTFKYEYTILTGGIKLPISQNRRKMIREQCIIFANME